MIPSNARVGSLIRGGKMRQAVSVELSHRNGHPIISLVYYIKSPIDGWICVGHPVHVRECEVDQLIDLLRQAKPLLAGMWHPAFEQEAAKPEEELP